MQAIYNRLPVFLQNLVCSLYGWIESRKRLGRDFNQALSMLLSTEFDEEDKIREKQRANLIKALTVAKANDFYSTELSSFTYDDIKSNPVQVYESLPYLSKEKVAQNSDIIRDKNFSHLIMMKTSGTTGKSNKGT